MSVIRSYVPSGRVSFLPLVAVYGVVRTEFETAMVVVTFVPSRPIVVITSDPDAAAAGVAAIPIITGVERVNAASNSEARRTETPGERQKRKTVANGNRPLHFRPRRSRSHQRSRG